MSRKDVTDFMVCLAYYKYRDEINKAFVPSKIFGMMPGVKWPYETLHKWTGEPIKVCYRAIERAYDRGYIEYGVSLRSGWLTDKGKELLRVEAQKKVEKVKA